MENSGFFVFVSATVLAVALIAWWVRVSILRWPRALGDLGPLRATLISRFEEGVMAKIVGSLEYDGEPLTSPLTGRACAYYHITVEQYVDANGTWYEVIREEKRLHFAIRDVSGRALIDTGNAEVVADFCIELKSGTFDDPTPQELKYLEAHGKDGKGWFFNKKLRYREGILEQGELVSILGFGMLEPDPDGGASATGYRDLPPQRLRMNGTLDEPLIISDNAAPLR